MPEGGNHRSRPKPCPRCAAREISNGHERIGRDGEIHAMVLARPDRVHAALVGDLAERDEFLVEALVALAGIEPFHMDEEGELHAFASLTGIG